MDEEIVDMLEYRDDGFIELVLKLLARLCDGQHSGLQVGQPKTFVFVHKQTFLCWYNRNISGIFGFAWICQSVRIDSGITGESRCFFPFAGTCECCCYFDILSVHLDMLKLIYLTRITIFTPFSLYRRRSYNAIVGKSFNCQLFANNYKLL